MHIPCRNWPVHDFLCLKDWGRFHKAWYLSWIMVKTQDHQMKNVFFLIFKIIIIFFLLYNILLVLPYINMNPPWVYTCTPSWTLLPPPSPYHSSGSFQCTSPKLPVSCIEPGLMIHFLYDTVHVSMPFSQIILPLPLPQSPKDCSIHLCLFCCLTYRVTITIFLNSIYMH